MSATDGGSDRHRCLWLTKGLGRGGVERLLLDMYALVDRQRFEVDVAYLLPWKDNYHEPLEQAGARVHCLGSRAGVADLRWLIRLGRLLAARRYSVVHSHAPIPAAAARLLTLAAGGAVMVHTEHNMWDRYRLPTRMVNSLTYARNAEAIAVSDVVAKSIQPWPARRRPPVRTIHHGTSLDSIRSFDDDERRRRRSELGLPNDRFLIGNVGNFTAKKDHHNLLNSLAGDGPVSEAHLVLIGLGPLEDELRAAVSELGLDGRVTFLGSRGDVFELLPLMDAFCLSSEFEGFPIALVEAMATGVACVATRVGGIPEIVVDQESGLLVAPKDPEALRRAIEQLMTDDDLRITLAEGAKKAAGRLDLRNSVAQMEEVYLDALGLAKS